MGGPKRITARIIILVLACAMIAASIALSSIQGFSSQGNRVHHHLIARNTTSETERLSIASPDENSDFSTHLPIVIVDTNGDDAHAGSVWDAEKGYRVAVDFDPYAYGTLMLIDNTDALNHLTDPPVLETDIRMKRRGHSSSSYNKGQYLVKMINEDGSKNRQDVLGMGSDWEWILNISYIDKSLIRNYLCLNMSGEITENTPEVRCCELFFRNGEDYEYRGLYLMMETVKQGPDRVNIAEYDSHFAKSSYILCRDRYSESGLMLNNYGTREGLTYGYLDVKYPSQDEITDATLHYIEEDIDKLEQALFSDNVNEFLLYREYIDVDSFVSYFIINEFFANYDAGYNSFYMYKDTTGKLCLGPVWDFDQTIDNNYPEELKVDSTAMHDGTWFRQLLRDAEFAYKVTERYHKLRNGILSDAYLENYIDETIAFLGTALERDWKRWQYNDLETLLAEGVYEKVPPSLLVNTRSFSEEIDHMKQILFEHGTWMDENIDSLYQFKEFEIGTQRETAATSIMEFTFGGERTLWAGGVAVILIIIAFFCSILIIQRE